MNKTPDLTANRSRIALEVIEKHLSQNESSETVGSDDIAFEEFEHDGEYKRLEVEFLRLKVKRYKKDTKLRNGYAEKLYNFMIGYTIFMALIVVFSGLAPLSVYLGIPLHLKINDLSLSTLIGGAFASAVGLVAFVVKGLFPQDRKEMKDDKG